MLGRVGRFSIVLAICSIASTAHAQIELIEIGYPIRARHLAGVVLDPSGAGVPGVLIGECAVATGKPAPEVPAFASGFGAFQASCGGDNEHVVAWAVSDSAGHFAVPNVTSARAHKLVISAAGFDPIRLTVRLRRIARKEMRITLKVAA